MKKRLLSAALALAMVLTMLPLSLMPAFAADSITESGKYTVTWRANGYQFKAASGSNPAITAPGDGYYYYNASTGALLQATDGVLAGTNTSSGVWYASLDDAINAKKTSIVLISDQGLSGNLDNPRGVTSLTIDVNGHVLNGAANIPGRYNDANNKPVNNSFSKLTIKNNGASSSFTVTVGAPDPYKTTATTVEIQGGTVGSITAYSTNCTITLNGVSTGAVSMNGSGCKVNATDSQVGGVSLSGTSMSLTGTNAHVKAVTLFGHDGTGLTEAQKGSLVPPAVTLNGGSATSITGNDANEKLTKAYAVTLNTNAKVNSITLTNGDVTVNNSAAGAVSITGGALKLNGSATGPASAAGGITLGNASMTVTGSYVSTGNIGVNNGGVVTVPNDDTNTFGKITGAGGRGISGGVWASAVPEGNLNSSLVYQVKGGVSSPFGQDHYVYYAQNQFQKLVDAYQTSGDVEIILVKDGGKSNTITFKNGDEILTVINYSKPSMPISLPTEVNGGKVSKWTEFKGLELIRDLVNTAGYSTPNPVENRVLNAQVTENTITKLTGVATDVAGLTARLSGNVITLSGAIPANTTEIKIKVTTDGKPGITNKEVSIVYDASNGSVRFANQTLTDTGMWITNDWAYLVMPNDTTRYSLNGSGLKVQALESRQIHGYDGDLPVLVGVTCSGTGWTTARKNALAGAMNSNSITLANSGTGSSGVNFFGSKVVFKDSTAVLEALNTVVAGISASQVNSWVTNAQNAAWRRAGNTGTPNATQRDQTGYKEVHVVAYMAVTISNYNTASTPGTLTMTLTPSYYVEVTGANGAAVGEPYNLRDNVSAEVNARRPVNGRTLGSLTGDVGKVSLTFKWETGFNAANTVAHQNSTYAYPISGGNTYEITHATNGSLGTFVINGEAALVKLTNPGSDGVQGGGDDVDSFYDTLQAAVDDAKNNGLIDVDANYKGSCAITVTGLARKFKINTHGANRVTSNVSGVVTETVKSTEYEVQLEKDSFVSNTTITVAANNNGTTTTNVSSAAPGSTVTITATPKDGYKVGTPTVKTNTGASVTVSGSNGSYTFTVPAGATSITVTPNYVLNTGLPFEDVAATAWYFDGVKYCYETTVSGNRLMQGFSETQFGPTHNFTRAEMVTILWNLRGRPAAGVATKTYTDVPASHWAYSAITWAANNGYADGYGNGRFGPDNPVLRDELVEFLWKFAGRPAGLGSLNSYSDGASVPQWARNSMSWAVGYNILSGRSSVGLSGTIYPVTAALRCEVAVTVMQYHRLYG